MALCVAFSPDGSRLAAGGADRTIRIFDTKSGQQTHVLRNHADWVESIAFSPDGAHVLSASRDRTVRISNPLNGELEATNTSFETPVLNAIFSKDGETVLSLAQNSPLIYWKWLSSEKKPQETEVTGHPDHLAWLSSALALAGADSLVRIESTHHEPLFTLYGHPDAISALATGPTADQFATGSYDGTVCVWNLACGTWVRRFIASPTVSPRSR